MPEPTSKPSKSFADAHDEWVRTHTPSPWRRFRDSKLFPPRNSSRVNKTLGYLWRIFLFSCISLISYETVLRLHLRSESFAEIMEQELQSFFSAQSVECSPLRWKNRSGSIAFLEAQGSESSSFEMLRAERVNFDLTRLKLFRENWALRSVMIQQLELRLRGATLPGEEDEAGSEVPKIGFLKTIRPLKAGFGVNQQFENLSLDRIDVTQANVYWGNTPYTRGYLEKGRVSATRTDTGYSVIISSGVIHQNWLHDLDVEALEFTIEDDALHIQKGEFRFDQRGTLSLKGSVQRGEIPELDLEVNLHSIELETLLAKQFAARFTGLIDATVRLTGSPNSPAGVRSSGTVTVREGILRGIEALETLTSISADQRFRRLKISEGDLNFTAGNGVIEVSRFSLSGNDFAKLRGNLVYSESSNEFRGKMHLGIQAHTLAKYPALIEARFPLEEDNLRWNESELQGTLDSLSSTLASELARDVRKIMLQGEAK